MATEAFIIAITTQGTKEVQRDLQGIGTAGTKAGEEVAAATTNMSSKMAALGSAFTNLDTKVNALNSSLRLMRNLLVTFSFLRAITDITEGISAVQQTSNMLAQVTHNSQQQAAAFDMLANAAMKVHAPLQSFASMVVAIERSSASFGKSTADVTKATQTMFATFALSGLDESQIANVSKDMREVFNLGMVQGRQFRAIITQDQQEALVLSQYIHATGVNAAAANKALEGMRKAGQEPSIYELSQKFKGAFTGQDVLNANIAANADMMERMKRNTTTLGQAFTDLHTSFDKFLNDANQATGVTAALSNGVEFLADNMHLLVTALAAVGVILITRYVALPLAAWFTLTSLSVARFAIVLGVDLLRAVGQAVIALTSLGTTTLAVLADTLIFGLADAGIAIIGFIGTISAAIIPLLAVGALLAGVFGAIWAAAAGFITAIGQLSGLVDPFKGLHLTLQDLPELFDAVATVVTTQWPLVVKTFQDVWNDGIAGMENRLGQFGNNINSFFERVSPLNIMGKVPQGVRYQTNRVTNSAAGDISALGRSIASEYQLNRETKLGLGPQGGVELDQGGLKPPSDNTPKVDKVLEATKAFEQFLKTVSPYAKEMEEMEAANVAFNKAQVAGVNVTKILNEAHLTREEINRRIARSVTGAGNAETDYADKIRILDVALRANNITLGEHDRLAAQAKLKELTANPLNMGAGIQAGAIKSGLDLQDVNKIGEDVATSYLKLATASDLAKTQIQALDQVYAGGVKNTYAYADSLIKILKTQTDLSSGVTLAGLEASVKLTNEQAIAAEALSKVYEHADAAQTLTVQMRALNEAVAENPALMKAATQAAMDLNIAYLKTQTDAASGFTAGMLEVQKSMNDFAQESARVWPDLFNGINTSLSNLIDQTGTFTQDVHKMTTGVISDLTQVFVRQTVTAPLANALFGGGNAQAGGSLLGAITGAPASLLGVNQLGASPSNPMWVQVAGPLGGGVGGSVGGITLGGGTIGGGGIGGGGMPVGDYITPSGSAIPAGTGGLLSGLGGLLGGGGAGGGGSVLGFLGNLWNSSGGLGSTSNWVLNQMGLGLQTGNSADILGSTTQAGGIGDALAGAGDWLMGLLGFAGGGEFDVGGMGGTDSQFVAFRASPDEHVSVTKPGQMSSKYQADSDENHFHFHFGSAEAVDSFNRSRSQVIATAAMMADRHKTRNGGGARR